jgi:hypothetical protein
MHLAAQLNQESITEGTIMDLRGESNVHFTDKLKCLVSKVNSELNDNINVKNPNSDHEMRSHMGQMKELFGCKDVTNEIKMMIYLATPMNTVGWG